MKVTFHLRRRPESGPASAAFLESDRVESALDLASRQGEGHPPKIHRVAGGFVLELPEGAGPPAGAIRLRRLAPALFVPVDADLVPALLDDEAEGLTRDRGLVFLPGGRILAFDPARLLRPPELVEAPRAPDRPWRAFPDRPARADRIREIELEPEGEGEAAGDPFEVPGDPAGIGSAGPPRPLNAGAASTMAGRAAAGAGRGLIGLGALLGIRALADLGARWVGRAVERAPRLAEALLGRQEVALRELLRQFREGDVDRALRHALPLGGTAPRGSTPSADGVLPEVDPAYSLRSLLGSGRGPGGIWFAGPDVRAELAREYRKAAEEAERRGDYRRAASIHGRLLDDYRTAAHLLASGGLHRDAAVVYLDRLGDVGAAAHAFEAAGEADRALKLYRGAAMHAEAGDLLRRLGEGEAAVGEYLLAADRLAEDPHHGPVGAGDLLRDRAGRPDLALGHYARGWGDRPSSIAVPCGLRIAAILADRGEAGPLLGLVDEADAVLARPGHDLLAGEFYNGLARLADRPGLAGARDEIRDRALMGLAARLREGASAATGSPGSLISAFLGRSGAWAPEVVADAAHAIRAATGRGRSPGPRRGPASLRRIPVGGGVVSAACHAPATGEVFLGFEGGRVYRVDVGRGVATCLARERLPVSSIAVDPEGRTVLVLLGEGPGPRRLVHLAAAGPAPAGLARMARMVDGPGDFWLTPVIATGDGRYLGVWNGEELILMGGVGALAALGRLPMPFLKAEPHAALLAPPRAGEPPWGSVLIHDGPNLCHVDARGQLLHRRYLGWRPTLPEGHTLRSVPPAWLRVDPERVELAGVDYLGVAYWSALRVIDAELIRTSNNSSAGVAPFAATAVARAGLVAAVGASGVDWLRAGPRSFTRIGTAEAPVPSAIACFPSHRDGELVIVDRDGTLVCLPIPR